MTSISIVAYLMLFAGTAIAFLVVALLLGRLLRPSAPTPAKLEPYECGEPAVGSSFVQFDLRFYVVALVFIIFEVELAFFFPWAVVYGKLTQASSPQARPEAVETAAAQLAGHEAVTKAPAARDRTQSSESPANDKATLRRFALVAIVDMAVFFGVLLVGFAYVWRRGDLDWVRATRSALTLAEPTSTPQVVGR